MPSKYEITRPDVPPLVDGKYNAVKCNNCGNIRMPPRSYCNVCQSEDLTQILFETKGTIITWSTTYKRKGQDTQNAFGSVAIKSVDGKDNYGVSCTFMVENNDFSKLDIGKEVVLVPHDSIRLYKLVEDA